MDHRQWPLSAAIGLFLLVAAAACLAAENAPAKAPAGPPPPVLPVIKTPLGPGEDTGRGYKVCQPNDSTPDDSVVDGYRKVSLRTPFGNACRWDPVGR